MSSLALRKDLIESSLRTQYYLLSCIAEEIHRVEIDRYSSASQKREAMIELEEYKTEILKEIEECEENLEMFEKESEEIVLKLDSFKKGGQLW